MNLNYTIKNINEEIANAHLSLEVGFDNFSYCIINLDNKKVITVEHFEYKGIQNSLQLCQNIIGSIKNSILIGKHFKSSSVAFSNQKSTLVPTSLFISQNAKDYLNFTNHVDADDEIIKYEKLNSLDIYNVYAFSEIVEKTIKSFFNNLKTTRITNKTIKNTIYL